MNGGYVFKIVGYEGESWFRYGKGKFDSANGVFSGVVTCDPGTTVGGKNCGSGGPVHCVSATLAAIGVASVAQCVALCTGGACGNFTIHTENLPVSNVTRKW